MEVYELREKPELKISIFSDSFQIVDGYDFGNNGVYQFDNLIEIFLKEERTNWWISVFSIVFDLFSGSAVGGRLKDKANLIIELKNKKIKIYLLNADIEKAKQIADFLKGQIS